VTAPRSGIIAATFVVRARSEVHARELVQDRSEDRTTYLGYLSQDRLSGFEIVQVVPLEPGTFEVQATWED
jgi:hypothetical protein